MYRMMFTIWRQTRRFVWTSMSFIRLYCAYIRDTVVQVFRWWSFAQYIERSYILLLNLIGFSTMPHVLMTADDVARVALDWCADDDILYEVWCADTGVQIWHIIIRWWHIIWRGTVTWIRWRCHCTCYCHAMRPHHLRRRLDEVDSRIEEVDAYIRNSHSAVSASSVVDVY